MKIDIDVRSRHVVVEVEDSNGKVRWERVSFEEAEALFEDALAEIRNPDPGRWERDEFDLADEDYHDVEE